MIKSCEECGASFEGKRSDGRFCSRKCADRNYRQRNKERLRAYDRRRYREHPGRREAQIKTARKHRLANPERKAAIDKAWYEANRERSAETTARWRANHPELMRLYRERYNQRNPIRSRLQYRALYSNQKAKAVGAPGKIRGDDILRVAECLQWRCGYCGRQLDLPEVTVDHIVPFARGGCNTPANITIACAACNKSKGVRLPEEFVARGSALHAG